MNEIIQKATSMIEALPFIQRFRGETVVVKFGGSLMEDERACRGILQDVAFMEVVGLRPVVVHGGGKAISKAMEERALQPVFVHGLRATDETAIRVVEDVLNHQVNPRMVSIIASHGCRAQGIYGQDVLTAVRHEVADPETGAPLDLGFVGDVESVDPDPMLQCLDRQTVPVVTPVGRGKDGHLYNINADRAAAAVACALQARKLVFLSDVPGLLRDPGDPASLISHVVWSDMDDLIATGVIRGGMIPKITSAVQTIQTGVNKVHIIDSSMPHSLLLELFTEEGVGTEIVRT